MYMTPEKENILHTALLPILALSKTAFILLSGTAAAFDIEFELGNDAYRWDRERYPFMSFITSGDFPVRKLHLLIR